MQGELDSYSIEKRYLRKDGQFVWVQGNTFRPADESGRLTYSICVSVIEDIAARKEAEAALLASRQRLFGIIDSAMDAIITVDQQHRVVLFNPAAEQMFGCTAEQAMGGPVDRFIPDCLRKAHQDHVRRYADTGETARGMGHLGAVSRLCGLTARSSPSKPPSPR